MITHEKLGLSPRSKNVWANRKSRWRKATRKVLHSLDDLIAASNKGRHVPMGDIYVMARALVDLGTRGLELRDTMPAELRRPNQPAKSLAGLCAVLESGSEALRSLAIRQNTPLVDFPMFQNKLVDAGMELDVGALTALDEMRKTVGE